MCICGKDNDQDKESRISGTSRIHIPLLSPGAALPAALCALPVALVSSFCLMLNADLHAAKDTTTTNTTMAATHAWW